MPRWFYALLLAAPAALVARLLSAPDLLVFALSALSLIPLAGLIGRATDDLAHYLGPQFGGLLNATFGNAAELIITIFAVQRGLLELVKASITGSIIGNLLLVAGAAVFAGGIHRGRQQFNAGHTSVAAAMMILAVAGLYLPATFAFSVHDGQRIEQVSLLVAVVLGLIYLTYLADSTLSRRRGSEAAPSTVRSEPAEPTVDAEQPSWSKRQALPVLAGATLGAVVASELLVGTVETVTIQLGWSEFFIGVIVVPIIGNAAEHFSAVQMAWRDRLDVTFAIVVGSSTQIALFVAPLLVFLSLALGHPMDLVFQPLELVILGLATAITAYINLDGESTWLEGAQLLALYLMAAIAFFFLPVPH